MISTKTSLLRSLITLFGTVLYSISVQGQLAVNEFNSKRGFTDENGDDVDWVEVFNYSSDSVFLADYFLSDNPDNLDKWQFPNTYLGSQELITICASGREDAKFPNHWEALVLANGIWKYWNGSSPPTNYNDWNQLGFNDQSWNSGQGGIVTGIMTIILPLPLRLPSSCVKNFRSSIFKTLRTSCFMQITTMDSSLI